MRFDLVDLQLFIAVADNGSITHGAMRAHLALASASARIKALEANLVFWQGALTNALNPKVAMFFLAFLPQFVDADAPHKPLAFLMLGLIFIFNGTLWCLAVAVAAARAAVRVQGSASAIAWINRGLGALFVYLGVRIAFAQAKWIS